VPNHITTVDIDFIARTKELDAAVYLLGRMLGTNKPGMDSKREIMELILVRLRRTGELDSVDKHTISELFKEFST
jgi:hypothetical protein